MLLTKEIAKQLTERPPKRLENIPNLDCDVMIRALTGTERLEYFERSGSVEEGDVVGGIRMMAELVALSVVDEDGRHIYSIDDIDDILSLNLKAVTFIAEAASALNGLSLDVSEGNF